MVFHSLGSWSSWLWVSGAFCIALGLWPFLPNANTDLELQGFGNTYNLLRYRFAANVKQHGRRNRYCWPADKLGQARIAATRLHHYALCSFTGTRQNNSCPF